MPIRPENRARYPSDWRQIRERLLVRAGNRCEGTWQHPNCRSANGEPHPETGCKVVLTIAHWPDHAIENVNEGNLLVLCQRCHLALDHLQHGENARRTRERRRGQMRLPDCETLVEER